MYNPPLGALCCLPKPYVISSQDCPCFSSKFAFIMRHKHLDNLRCILVTNLGGMHRVHCWVENRISTLYLRYPARFGRPERGCWT